MSKFIASTPRPVIAYEHPDFKMHLATLREHVIRQCKKRTALNRNDEAILAAFSGGENDLKKQCEALLKYFAEAFVHYSVGITAMPITQEDLANKMLELMH